MKRVSWRTAERIQGQRLDRRRAYASDGKRVYAHARFKSGDSWIPCEHYQLLKFYSPALQAFFRSIKI